MDSAKNQLVEKFHSSINILVTVSRNPSVDQLAACLGLTLLLNKLDKHATAVFSGEVPSTIEFLEPEQTLEKNTDSLRDFIIALDKSKADKLRYKVEDQLVRIFITPYKTSINQNDLEFSQGDFNVDLVVALGVLRQEDLDEAITAHGRILHDATVASINVVPEGGLGSINWQVTDASSLSELVTDLSRELGPGLLDQQIATALLTGIVAETQRFSNEKTSPKTMSASAELMAAGANQQLVATKLDEPVAEPFVETEGDSHDESEDTPAPTEPTPAPKTEDGTLEIEHEKADSNDHQPSEIDKDDVTDYEFDTPHDESSDQEDLDHADEPNSEQHDADYQTETQTPEEQKLATDLDDQAQHNDEAGEERTEEVPRTSKLITEAPQMPGSLTANDHEETLEPSIDPLSLPLPLADPLSLPSVEPPVPLLDRSALGTPLPPPKPVEPLLTGFTPPPPAWVPPSDDALQIAQSATHDHEDTGTLTDVEQSEQTPHLEADDVNDARDQVAQALNSSSANVTPEPIAALNAQPLGSDLHTEGSQPEASSIAQPSADFMSTLQKTIPAAPPITSNFPAAQTPISPTLDIPTPSQQPTYEDAPGNEVVPSLVLPPTSPGMFASSEQSAPSVSDPNAPPPVPPPIPFRFGNTTEPPRQ